ncbi:hypothetical protein HBH55_094760 [Parastagonospora nodorum]|nr:hypothetical protein HBH84_163750 [Parastagonospora nodorum]KAH4631276.1 hypothetical protein HBH55_094760 [Parastagonospora nodorum]
MQVDSRTGPILNKLKPRVATLEQTSSLSTYNYLAEEVASYYYSVLFLKECIITNSREEKYYYNSAYKYISYKLSNTIKQISNTFLLVIAEKLYYTITKTLKAFN